MSPEHLVIDPPTAFEHAQSGDLLIIDVRSRSEWAQTGIPSGARTVSLQDEMGTPNRQFMAEVEAATENDHDRPIAFICAAGIRSSVAREIAEAAGFSRAVDISEGMMGNPRGPGWLRRGLPLDACLEC